MKREYVVPTMESEVFVTNEYVAACYAVVCNGQAQDRWHISSDLYIADDGLHQAHGTIVSGLKDEPTTYRKRIFNRGDDSRLIARNDSPQGYTYNGMEHWGVTVENRANDAHPNASA